MRYLFCMKRKLEIAEIETYRTAAQLALVTGRFTAGDYIAVLECLQAQVQEAGAVKARPEVPGRKAMMGN
jgi:hypothetical protein